MLANHDVNLIPGMVKMPEYVQTRLYDFALCRKNSKHDPSESMTFQDYLADLVELASPENWGTDNKVLFNYVIHLFEKVACDYNKNVGTDKATEFLYMDDKHACFNTGLYTEKFEYIYCLFDKNRHPEAPSPWYLAGFFKESANQLRPIGSLPSKVQLFDDPAQLIYDYRLPVRTNKDHILSDPRNFDRLPLKLRELDDHAMLSRLFDGAVMEATKRVASNYTLAVPQYHKGSIQLLLPICLTSNDPELALAVHRDADAYSARTCLTLDMAYNNARLIVKPEASWIRPA